MALTKVCGKCKQEKGAAEFYKRTASSSGLSCWCKQCQAVYQDQNRQRIREQKHARYMETREQRLDVCHQYYQENKEKIAERDRAYREKHRWEIAINKRAYYLANRERFLANGRQRYIENPDYAKKYSLAWAKAHPEVSNARAMRYRARKLGAPGAAYTTSAMMSARWELYGGRCYICGGEAEAMDHVKPLIAGGAHLPCNLRPICARCNGTKAGQWPYEPIKAARCP